MKTMTKEQAFEFLKNKKTMVVNEEQSKEVQKKLFEIGFEWVIGGANVLYVDNHYLSINDFGYISYNSGEEYFKNSDLEFILPFDILDIEIVEEKKGPQFEFGQLVLVRDKGYVWSPAQFAFIGEAGNNYPYVIFGGRGFEQCIALKGNEHLMGTSKDKEE